MIVAGTLAAERVKLLSPARLAVRTHVPVPLNSVTAPVVAFTAHAVDPVESKLYAPVPLPPVAVAVNPVGYVASTGAEIVTAACVAF